MSSSFFYQGIKETDENKNIIVSAKLLSENKKLQLYLIRKQLGDEDPGFEYADSLIVLAPKHKILLIDYGLNQEKMGTFFEDFIEDLSALSHKYRYKNILGRSRDWHHLIAAEEIANETCSLHAFEQILDRHKIEDAKDRKHGELLISLLTGSINNIDRVKSGVPDNILDKVKQKILLFDGDQTRFIYDMPDKKWYESKGFRVLEKLSCCYIS